MDAKDLQDHKLIKTILSFENENIQNPMEKHLEIRKR